ncbi:MAG: hypothetical protein HY711_00765 [Candidatus Melainabacteria bacterium]|nr:hypothetical protein [Candidatus Melainabacteria bacterium]
MRSRFGATGKSTSNLGKGSTIFRQLGLLAVVLVLGALGVSWSLSDISGEYESLDPELGPVRLTLIRLPVSFKGQIAFGTGAPRLITDGKLVDGKNLELKFQVPSEDLATQSQTATFTGVIGTSTVEGNYFTSKEFTTLEGVLEEGSSSWTLTLTRNALASLYRQLQSHLPWLG